MKAYCYIFKKWLVNRLLCVHAKYVGTGNVCNVKMNEGMAVWRIHGNVFK